MNNRIMKNDFSIDVLRILAAFAVVVIHIMSLYTNEVLNSSKSLWWFANIFNSFSRWSVLIFIMISGSLLVNDKSFQDTNLFFKKRVSRILIPLVFWSMFFIGFNINITGFFTTEDTIGRLYIGEPYYHLWYLFLIVGVYFVTPVISLVYANYNAKSRGKIIICIFIAGAINSMWSKYFGQKNQFSVFKFLPYIGCFMIGKEIFLSQIRYNQYFYLVMWFLSSIVIAIMTGMLRHVHKEITYFYDYLYPLVIVQSISFYVLMKKFMFDKNLSDQFKKVLAKGSMLTLGIYIVYPIIIELVTNSLQHIDGHMNYILVPTFTFFVFMLSGLVTFIFTKIPYLKNLV